MKTKCTHSWEFSHQTPNGEDRVLKYYVCRLCPKTSRRNVKKPRFTASLRRKPSVVPKLSKTLQKGLKSKRRAIKPVSDKRKNWLKQYEAKKKAEPSMVWGYDVIGTKVIRVQMFRSNLEAHHPLARIGCRILFYAWVSPMLHEVIHDNPKWAREKGFLLPEYDGRESGPDQKDPLNILPEYRAYVSEHGLH